MSHGNNNSLLYCLCVCLGLDVKCLAELNSLYFRYIFLIILLYCLFYICTSNDTNIFLLQNCVSVNCYCTVIVLKGIVLLY